MNRRELGEKEFRSSVLKTLLVLLIPLLATAVLSSSFRVPTNDAWTTGAFQNTTVGSGDLVPSQKIFTDNFTDNALGSDWNTYDGDGDSGTSFSERTNMLAISAGGKDIANNADEYGSVYRSNVNGNWTARVTVISQENTQNSAKAGIMVRNDMTLSGQSAGYVMVMATPGSSIVMGHDSDGDGFIDTTVSGCSSTYPVELRLVKNGDSFTGECSTDGGATWTTLNTVTITAATTQDVGLSVTSRSNRGTLSTAEFDDWQLAKDNYFTESAYSSKTFSPGSGNRSWTTMEIEAPSIPAGANLTANVSTYDYSGAFKDSYSFDVSQGLGNYSLNLPTAPNASLRFEGSLSSASTQWRVNYFELYHFEGLSANPGLNKNDSKYLHQTEVWGSATTASSISSCTVHYSPDFTSNWLSTSVTPVQSGNTYYCNQTFNDSLNGIGYGDLASGGFKTYFEFTASNGVSETTDNHTFTLPNNNPSIVNTATPEQWPGHRINFYSNATDADWQDGELTSCTITAGGNTYGTATESGNYTTCNATVSNSDAGISVGDTISLQAQFTDIAGASVSSSIFSATVPNIAPSSTSLSTSSSPGHNLNLSFTLSDQDGASDVNDGQCRFYASDGDGNKLVRQGTVINEGSNYLCYSGNVNDSITGFEVSESIEFTGEFTDKFGAADNTSSILRSIPNNAPTAPSGLSLNISDKTSVVKDQFRFNWTNGNDSDKDDLEMTAYMGTSPNPTSIENSTSITESEYGSVSTLMTSTNLARNETYYLDLELCDSWSCATKISDSFRVNDLPNIISAGQNTTDAPVAEIRVNASDYDGVQKVYFRVNESGSSILKETVSTPPPDDSLWNSTSFTVNSGTSYSWKVYVSDGTENSTSSGSFKGDSTPPEIVSGPFTSQHQSEHAFNTSIEVKDTDGVSQLNYTAYLENTSTSLEVRDTVSDTGISTFINISNVSDANFSVGDTVSVYFEISDGTATVTSSSVTTSIPNRAPGVTVEGIKPDSPETIDDLTLNFTDSDPEDDSIVDRYYRWYNNTNNQELSRSSTLSSDAISEGSEVYVEVRSEDEYGESSGYVSSNPVTILNSPPSITKNITVENVSSHTISVTARARDPNGAEDFSTCDFTLAGSSVGGTPSKNVGGAYVAECNVTLNETDILPGNTKDISAKFTDDNSSTATTPVKSVTTPNEKPSVSITGPVNGSMFNQDSIDFSWTGSDPDGDDLNYTLDIDGTSEVLKSSSVTRTVSGDGLYNWSIRATDSLQGANLSNSSTKYALFEIDTTPPSNLTEISVEPVNGSMLDQDSGASISVLWTDSNTVGKAYISDNITRVNRTVSISEGWSNYTISSSELSAGTINVTVTGVDNFNNSKTLTTSDTINDTEKPVIDTFRQDPVSRSELDPGKTVYFNTTVSDNTNIGNVTFFQGQNSYTYSQATKHSGYYSSSFTPSAEGNYTAGFTVYDKSGNSRSINYSFAVQKDYNWNYFPGSVEGSSTLSENRSEFPNVTIENGGDYVLEYSFSADTPSGIFLNFSNSTIKLKPGDTWSESFTAYLDSGSEGVYDFTVSIEDNKTTTETVDGRAAFTQEGPYLIMSRGGNFPLSAEQGEKIRLETEIQNDGTQTANFTSVTGEYPSGWSPSSESQDLGNISVGDSAYHRVDVQVPEDAETGVKNLNYTASTGNRSFTGTFQVEILNDTSTTSSSSGSEETLVFGGGGSSGPTNQEQVEESTDRIFNTSDSFEIVRGQDQNFSIEFQNPTEFNLTNITVEVTGIQSQYLNLVTTSIDSVPVNRSENITVAITAPEYFQPGDYTLNFNITGKGVQGSGFYTNYFDFTLEKQIELGVKEISRQNASNLVNQTRQLREELKQADMNTENIERLVSQAEENYNSGDYGSVRQTYHQVRDQYQTAREVRNGLDELKTQINSAQAQGLDVGRARRVANLAEAAMERGAYSTAAERLEEAQNIYQLETAGEVNWMYEIRSNWKKVVAGIFIVSGGGFLAWLRYRLYRIRRRLEAIRSEEQSIEQLKLDAQKRAFEKKSMSLAEYRDAVDDYNDEILELIEERVSLKTAEANITNFKRRASLAQERDHLSNLVKEAQEDYVSGDISDTDIYEEKVEELTDRLSEVEGEIAEIDARAEVRSKSRLGRIMEKIPLISSGGVTK